MPMITADSLSRGFFSFFVRPPVRARQFFQLQNSMRVPFSFLMLERYGAVCSAHADRLHPPSRGDLLRWFQHRHHFRCRMIVIPFIIAPPAFQRVLLLKLRPSRRFFHSLSCEAPFSFADKIGLFFSVLSDAHQGRDSSPFAFLPGTGSPARNFPISVLLLTTCEVTVDPFE